MPIKTKFSCKGFVSRVAVGTILISTADAAPITWTNANGGNWSAAVNWSPNQVPGNSDDAIITNAGTYTVKLDISPTVNS
jgi:hypothetical protein